ncbi:MAG: hydrogenase maturation nickel metallochaperone HypA [Alphaproteobacteria bacterium]|nr:hydrogenase maturation nickel metallochaperone HypA [Alphaproteobacteria bacterium]MBM3654502.1 hydrogenase maturation nickel metallochaperone HypA [Alphaproteobacteria bacterium]
MHEASLISSLMRRIDEAAKNERAKKVVGVSVWIGALSHMSAEHFAEHFERAAAGSVAEGARLEVTVSGDVAHVNAQDILLEKIELED